MSIPALQRAEQHWTKSSLGAGARLQGRSGGGAGGGAEQEAEARAAEPALTQ